MNSKDYQKGFADGVNCKCKVCAERRKALKAAAKKLRRAVREEG